MHGAFQLREGRGLRGDLRATLGRPWGGDKGFPASEGQRGWWDQSKRPGSEREREPSQQRAQKLPSRWGKARGSLLPREERGELHGLEGLRPPLSPGLWVLCMVPVLGDRDPRTRGAMQAPPNTPTVPTLVHSRAILPPLTASPLHTPFHLAPLTTGAQGTLSPPKQAALEWGHPQSQHPGDTHAACHAVASGVASPVLTY